MFFNPRNNVPKFIERLFQLYLQNASPRIQNPVVFCFDQIELGLAQSKAFPEQPFRSISVMRLADRFFRRGDPNSLDLAAVRQKEDRHVTALDTGSLLVNTQKLGALGEPSFASKTEL